MIIDHTSPVVSLLDLHDPRVWAGLHLVGVPYVYGAGAPRDLQYGDLAALVRGASSPRAPSGSPRGWDCNGGHQAVAVVTGRLRPTEPDRSAHQSLFACIPVSVDDLEPLDGVYYVEVDRQGRQGNTAQHVATYLGGGLVLTMSNGTSRTFGDDPRACGQIRPIDYRPGRRWLARWKPELAR